MNYEELSKIVNDSYGRTNNIRETMKETGLSFDEVWDMTGFKDWFDWMEGQSEYESQFFHYKCYPFHCIVDK